MTDLFLTFLLGLDQVWEEGANYFGWVWFVKFYKTVTCNTRLSKLFQLCFLLNSITVDLSKILALIHFVL